MKKWIVKINPGSDESPGRVDGWGNGLYGFSNGNGSGGYYGLIKRQDPRSQGELDVEEDK